MEVTFGTDFGAAAVLFVGAAASVGATGRFAVVEGTDVGFTAVIGRAALGAVAEPATRAGAAAVPAAGAAEPVLAGVGLGFVGAAAARGAPLAGRGCDGADFGVVAEEGADEVADVVGDAVAGVVDAGDGCEAAADGSPDGAVAAGLRGVGVALGGDATGPDEEACAGAAAAGAEFDAEEEAPAGACAEFDAEEDAPAVV